MNRQIIKTVQGKRAIDGAGVHLVRVLGNNDVEDFDPFLMLDSFDSQNPDDYTKGFPLHPHRGIETITYLINGEIDHRDSLGNAGRIGPGQAQWMTAGSGIMHEEMPQAADRMLGFQLWLNLPASQKMEPPHYYDITEDMIPAVSEGAASVRVIAGDYKGNKGASPLYVQATLYDVELPAGERITLNTNPEDNVFLFNILGDAAIEGQHIPEKTAALMGPGGKVDVAAENGPVRFIYYGGKPLRESIAWGGPIVMNTREELQRAFSELRDGTFLKG